MGYDYQKVWHVLVRCCNDKFEIGKGRKITLVLGTEDCDCTAFTD